MCEHEGGLKPHEKSDPITLIGVTLPTWKEMAKGYWKSLSKDEKGDMEKGFRTRFEKTATLTGQAQSDAIRDLMKYVAAGQEDGLGRRTGDDPKPDATKSQKLAIANAKDWTHYVYDTRAKRTGLDVYPPGFKEIAAHMLFNAGGGRARANWVIGNALNATGFLPEWDSEQFPLIKRAEASTKVFNTPLPEDDLDYKSDAANGAKSNRKAFAGVWGTRATTNELASRIKEMTPEERDAVFEALLPALKDYYIGIKTSNPKSGRRNIKGWLARAEDLFEGALDTATQPQKRGKKLDVLVQVHSESNEGILLVDMQIPGHGVLEYQVEEETGKFAGFTKVPPGIKRIGAYNPKIIDGERRVLQNHGVSWIPSDGTAVELYLGPGLNRKLVASVAEKSGDGVVVPTNLTIDPNNMFLLDPKNSAHLLITPGKNKERLPVDIDLVAEDGKHSWENISPLPAMMTVKEFRNPNDKLATIMRSVTR
ncbi:MAG: hypothetical protein K2X09_00185 [Rickettsiales bacterium]|nr:hypothetical protein [Rickettsiales bacterium]